MSKRKSKYHQDELVASGGRLYVVTAFDAEEDMYYLQHAVGSHSGWWYDAKDVRLPFNTEYVWFLSNKLKSAMVNDFMEDL